MAPLPGRQQASGRLLITLLLQYFADDRYLIWANGKIAGSILQVHHYLQGRPIVAPSVIGEAEKLSLPRSTRPLKALTEIGVARKITWASGTVCSSVGRPCKPWLREQG